MYQIEIDEKGNEVSTAYYYWSKVDGTSIELPIAEPSVSAPYYEIDGHQIVGDVSYSGRIIIHNGKKLLIHP
ncbi:MAG: hypothetical protein IKP91_07395 [Bacteroidaceae bacterium]|nr:hypothetical protein [Bacteroidaceae bacterium]